MWNRLKKYKVICPLINFKIPWNALIEPPERTVEESRRIFREREERVVKGINLVNGVKIRHISKEDLEDLKTLRARAFKPKQSRFLSVRWLVGWVKI